MGKRLNQIVMTGAALFSLVVVPYFVTNSYAEESRRERFRTKIKEYGKKAKTYIQDNRKKLAIEVLKKATPHNWTIEAAEKYSKEFDKYRKRKKGKVGIGTGVVRDKEWE